MFHRIEGERSFPAKIKELDFCGKRQINDFSLLESCGNSEGEVFTIPFALERDGGNIQDKRHYRHGEGIDDNYVQSPMSEMSYANFQTDTTLSRESYASVPPSLAFCNDNDLQMQEASIFRSNTEMPTSISSRTTKNISGATYKDKLTKKLPSVRLPNSKFEVTLLFFSVGEEQENNGSSPIFENTITEGDVNAIKKDLEVYGTIKLRKIDNVTALSMIQIIARERPEMVHIDTHGKTNGDLLLLVKANNSFVREGISPEEMQYIWNLFSGHLKFLFFDACYSDVMAKFACGRNQEASTTRDDYIASSIGIEGTIETETARTFMRSFYGKFASGETIRDSFSYAKDSAKKWCVSSENTKKRIILCRAKEWEKFKLFYRDKPSVESLTLSSIIESQKRELA